MEPQILAVYTRCYSEIPPLQQAGYMEYILCLADGCLRIAARAGQAGKAALRAVVCDLPEEDAGRARGLLQFLYENAVSIENIRDVVQDACGAAAAERRPVPCQLAESEKADGTACARPAGHTAENAAF